MRTLSKVLCLCLLGLAPATAAAQGGAEKPASGHPEAAPEAAAAKTRQETLQTSFAALAARRQRLDEARRALAAATTGEARKQGQQKVAAIEKDLAGLERRFEQLAAGVDRARLDEPAAEPFDLTRELETLLQPLIEQLEQMTEAPRRIEELRKEIAVAEQRRATADKAVANLEARVEESQGALRSKLLDLLVAWRDRRRDWANRIQIARYELDRKLATRTSLLESTGNLANAFFRRRGLNLGLAILAFFAVFLGLRLAYQGFQRVQPFRRRARRTLPARVADVLFHAFVVVAALAATLLVLYVANDWVLLVVTLVFLLGIGWGSIRILPQLFEQARLILDFGSVREGERILWQGLPWRVSSLGISTILENPALCGGWVRLPVRDLIGQHSRPPDPREGWFPSAEGDWVLLSDGTRGKVVAQTPERVTLQLPGGSPMFLPARAFLDANPKNLSQGFRVETTFGVDYEHLPICTTTMPEKMRDALRAGLLDLVEPDDLLRVQVELAEAAASSLDFSVEADFRGSAAAKYEVLERALARILVATCNDNGWVIPFQQITLHQASG